jgi:hypothetical protein
MRRVWTTIVAFWAMLAVVGVLAWTRQPSSPLPAAAPTVLVVKGKNGKQQLVVVQPAAAAHATTRSSPPPRP